MPANGVHFNGSVNLSDAETVMREISAHSVRCASDDRGRNW